MIRVIGFKGGTTIGDLGSVGDVSAFFALVRWHVKRSAPTEDWSLITDRLYKRYVYATDLERAQTMMNRLEEELKGISSSTVDWRAFGWNEATSRLKINQPSANDVFAGWISFFNDRAEGAKYNWINDNHNPKEWKQHVVQTLNTSVSLYSIDRDRTREQLDALGPHEPPFWTDDRNYPGWDTLPQNLSIGRISHSAPVPDNYLAAWIKYEFLTSTAKRYAARDVTNGLSSDQREYLSNLADAQDLDSLNPSTLLNDQKPTHKKAPKT
jgi:hypothetical protein